MGVMFKSSAEQQMFLSIILRLADYSGFVRVDGIEIQNISLQKLREKIFVIPQV
jgi:ABC-type multidrug transport system fused ATPase/permease subunit